MSAPLSGPSGASTSLLRHFVEDLGAPSSYRDRSYHGTDEELGRDLATTTTLYVGNLSFYTSEEQIHAIFSKCAPVKRIIMGLDRNTKTPCGFCFAEYFERKGALLCKKFLDGSKLDDRFVRVDLDPGFREGRQFGRGRSGGQVRDEMRTDYDPGRGGWGGSASLNYNEGDLPLPQHTQRGDNGPAPYEQSTKRVKEESSSRLRAEQSDEE